MLCFSSHPRQFILKFLIKSDLEGDLFETQKTLETLVVKILGQILDVAYGTTEGREKHYKEIEATVELTPTKTTITVVLEIRSTKTSKPSENFMDNTRLVDILKVYGPTQVGDKDPYIYNSKNDICSSTQDLNACLNEFMRHVISIFKKEKEEKVKENKPNKKESTYSAGNSFGPDNQGMNTMSAGYDSMPPPGGAGKEHVYESRAGKEHVYEPRAGQKKPALYNSATADGPPSTPPAAVGTFSLTPADHSVVEKRVREVVVDNGGMGGEAQGPSPHSTTRGISPVSVPGRTPMRPLGPSLPAGLPAGLAYNDMTGDQQDLFNSMTPEQQLQYNGNSGVGSTNLG